MSVHARNGSVNNSQSDDAVHKAPLRVNGQSAHTYGAVNGGPVNGINGNGSRGQESQPLMGGAKSPTRRMQVSDTELAEILRTEGYGYDYAAVFPTEVPGEVTQFAYQCSKDMMAAGLQCRLSFSCQDDEIYCEIRAPLDRLQHFADQINKKILLDKTALQRAAAAGDPEKNIRPIIINDDPKISKRSPYEHIYGEYNRDPALKPLYAIHPGDKHPFRAELRLQLLADIIKAPKRMGGAGINTSKLLADKKLLAFFPLHNQVHREKLRAEWLHRVCQLPAYMPFDQIKNYFGEKVGMYYHFLAHYTTWLMPLAVMGIITHVVSFRAGNPEHPITLVWAPFVLLWGILMLEFWKRKEKRVALEWGTIGFEDEEQDRPAFQGDVVKSPVDGREMMYFPQVERQNRIRHAVVVVSGMVVMVVACIAAIYGLKNYLVYGGKVSWGSTYGSIVASFASSVQISILNFVYKKVAISLNDYENHRTETEYEDSLILKLFAFQFCNSYGSFIYIAFVEQPILGIACEPSCIHLLCTNLTTIFLTQLILGNLTEVAMPIWNFHQRMKKETAGTPEGTILSVAETEYMLEPYDPVMGTLLDYAEIARQFGYLTLFVVAFPLAPVLALVNNSAEIKFDSYKLLKIFQRPVPRGCEDIGRWQDVFTFLTCAAVVTNTALVCLIYRSLIGAMSIQTRLWLFLIFQYVLFVFMKAVEAAVPDVPEDVELQLKRQEFLCAKLLTRIADEEDENFEVMSDDDMAKVNVKLSPRHGARVAG